MDPEALTLFLPQQEIDQSLLTANEAPEMLVHIGPEGHLIPTWPIFPAYLHLLGCGLSGVHPLTPGHSALCRPELLSLPSRLPFGSTPDGFPDHACPDLLFACV